MKILTFMTQFLEEGFLQTSCIMMEYGSLNFPVEKILQSYFQINRLKNNYKFLRLVQ